MKSQNLAATARAVWVLTAATVAGLCVTALFFAAAVTGQQDCRSTSWVGNAFVGSGLMTMIIGVITASAAYIAGRRQWTAALGGGLAVGAIATLLCVLLYFGAVVDWVGDCTA
jgi:hypothetical protein